MTLEQWRNDNRYSRPAFLKKAKEEGLEISVQTLYNWANGKFLPDTAEAEVIRKLTGGRVTPASFAKRT
jgi:hypothetical protein